MLDMDQIRADTPAAARRAYLHNAGAALMPVPVVAAMQNYLALEAEIGGYAAADHEAARLDAVYASVARLVNATPDEIALTENATVAWQMAFYALRFAPGDRILTAQAEYAANYVAFLQVARRTGAVIDVVPSDATGQLDVAALARMVDERVKLIAITWVPTNGGLVNPAAEVGKVARAHGIPYLLDACQAVGQMPVDVAAIGCDMLAATGRKFLRGPRGTGFLYVSPVAAASSWSRRCSIISRPHGSHPTATACATTPAGSRPGRTITSPGWGSAPRSTMRWRWDSTRSRRAAACWPTGCGMALPASRG